MLPLLALLSTAHGAELFWDGHYRAQAHLYRSLSLSESNPNRIQQIDYLNHWLKLNPVFRAAPNVAVHAQLDTLYLQNFGATGVLDSDQIIGDESLYFSQRMEPDSTDGAYGASNIRVSRVWTEWQSPVGLFKLGRMPLDWGTGMVFNPGDQATQFTGDTVDRFQYSHSFDSIYLMAATELRNEGFISEMDDSVAGNIALYYASERIEGGLYALYDHHSQSSVESSYGELTLDLFGKANSGPLNVEAEFAFIYGSGDLENGFDNIERMTFGGVLDAHLKFGAFGGGLNLGYAHGDDNPDDKEFKTFSFDRNYDISLMLFDQVLPTLAPSVNNTINQGLETSAALTGNAIGNAMYIQPRFDYRLSEQLQFVASGLFARAAVLPEGEENKNYGIEANADVIYQPTSKLRVQTKLGAFFPGNYFGSASDEIFGGGFDAPAYGAEANVIIDF